MEIVVLGFNGCLGAGFVGSVDMLKLSSLMISKNGRYEPFSVSTASFDGRPFKDSSDREFDVDGSITAIATSSAIVVPGYLCDDDARFLRRPRSPQRLRGCGTNMRLARWCVARAAACFCSAKQACSMADVARRLGGDTMS